MLSYYDKFFSISSSDILSFFSFHTLSYFGLVLLKDAAYAVIFLTILWLAITAIFKLIDLIHQLRQKYIYLEVTPPLVTEISSVSTSELFNLVAGLLNQRSWYDKVILKRSSFSFEIVSTKEKGIRYILQAPESIAQVIEKNMRAYIPGIKIQEASDYLPENIALNRRITEYKLAKHFSLPINEQSDLKKHDPLAYLAGNMTQLKTDELMAMQIVIRPLGSNNRRNATKAKMVKQNESKTEVMLLYFVLAIESIVRIVIIPLLFLAELVGGNSSDPLPRNSKKISAKDLEPDEIVKAKLSQPLFEGTIRTLLIAEPKNLSIRDKGLRASFASFMHASGQALHVKKRFKFIEKLKLWQFKNRLSGTPAILSSSEVSALYHFPFSGNNQTEDLIRVRSKELPAPLVLKNNNDLDVVFGKNHYGNITTDVGLTDEDRSRHVYSIGQTGSGKSTIIYHMASDDIKKGRGLAVIDPHGDLAEGLLDTVPKERAGDLIYFNPRDIKFPVGINLLELDESLEEDELELEKELVCESVISMFRRVFFKDEDANAHRIEYILRNTIHTAFVVPDRTIFTVYHILNDQNVRRQAIRNLKNEDLINFWKNEFGKAGDYQHVKMIGGITAKVGRFLFSATARRILEQPKSTISFDDILDNQKIIICNLAEGKLGEDTSQLLGATVLAKIQQAAVRRARVESASRKPFYLFVDEFQNFADKSFTKFLSGGRKFGLRITIAEQSTAQQDNRNITNVVLANTGTVICFRTASPVDEELMLSQFAPQVVQGDIGNLPRYRFYMKMAAVEPQEPMSGETIPITTPKDPAKVKRLIEASRKNYAIEYVKPTKKEMPAEQPKPSTKASPKKTSESAPAGLNSYK
ncbi:MAG: DUF87 domain-containing protein [Patescibacteria group bacterium]